MKLGIQIGLLGAHFSIDVDLIKEAEKLGYDSVWSAEAYGSDAVTPLAWLASQTTKIKLGAGIMQLPGRTPANTAMTAMTLDTLSNGRFILGLGTSGPQVVEGWHGQAFYKPLTWMREYVTIVKKILARKEKLEFQGEHYQIPFTGEHSKGLGKPLKSILHATPNIPFYSGSMAPKGQSLSAEMMDGCLLVHMHPGRFDVIRPNFEDGFAKAGGGKSFDNFDIAPTVPVIIGDDLDACRMPLKMSLALYLGGMGAKNKNFYNEYMRKVGFEEEAEKVQELYLAGKKNEAITAVTDEMIDTLYLVGPPDRIRERFQAWKDAPIGTMIIGTVQPEAVRLMAELAL